MSSIPAELVRIFHPHDPVLVLVSMAIAVFAAYVTLELAGRIRVTSGWRRGCWLMAAAATMGGGIWSMHFIAITALMLPFEVRYNYPLTFVSLAVSIAVTAAGLYVAFWKTRHWPHYMAAGAIMGAGVAAMHYIGMGAMEYEAPTSYALPTVFLSAIIAIVAATAALWLAVNLRRLAPRIASAFVMGVAVVGMHFTGMAAFLCSYTPGEPLYTTGASAPLLDNGVVLVVTVALLMAALGSVYADRRTRRASQMTLAQFSLGVIAAADLDDVFYKALGLTCDTMKTRFALIKEADGATGQVRCLIASDNGLRDIRVGDLADYSSSAPMFGALQSDVPVQHAGIDPESRAEFADFFGPSTIAASLTAAHRVTENVVLVVRAFSVEDRMFSESDMAFLRDLVNLLAMFKSRDLAMQEVRLRDRALAAIAQGVIITDETSVHRRVTYANKAFLRMTGYTMEQAAAPHPPEFVVPGSSPGLAERLALDAAKRRSTSFDCRMRQASGKTFACHTTASPIVSRGGDLTHYVWVNEDVTDSRRRDEKLREMQRNETLGQLTGGVAHEFNNLLAVVRSNAEDIRGDLKDNVLLHRQADMVVQAADRGAALVQQLLSYSRKKETEPEVVDVGAILVEFEELLKRTLESNIIINVIRGEDLPPIKVDPGQLEDAVLNLALNARDAMPQGGTLTIETAPIRFDAEQVKDAAVPPGLYVVVSVSDTGTGMTPDVVKRAFDPFFTTKDVGQGTGLGLSMVYGFVKQSGGQSKIYSEPGLGTTVKLYLPAAGEIAPVDAGVPETVGEARGTGRILLVEDNELLRQSVSGKLERLGYSVRAAAAGPEALGVMESGAEFDLVLTDVIMPGITGADLAREVQRRWPHTAILMTSGYTAAAVSGKVQMPPGVRLLSKPYSNAELVEAIRKTLTATAPRPEAPVG